MAHQIEQMAYIGATPWHGLGKGIDAECVSSGLACAALHAHRVTNRHSYCHSTAEPVWTLASGRIMDGGLQWEMGSAAS